MQPLPASSLPSPRAISRSNPAAGGRFPGVREARRGVRGGSKVWLRAAPGDRAECHLSLLSGIRSVSGPPAAFAFPATDTSGQLHFLLRSRVTFSSSRGSGPASSSGQKHDPQFHLDIMDEPS